MHRNVAHPSVSPAGSHSSLYLRRSLFVWALVLAVVVMPVPGMRAFTVSQSRAAPEASVLTQRNDNNRSGDNLNETTLTTSNVNVSQFGRIFTRAVDGQIYAQPLYVPGVSIAGGIHNVVYVATMHNTVYAFDADDPAQSAPLWSVNLGPSSPASDFGTSFHDISVEVGILSTPVIDPASNTVYVVAFTKETVNGTATYFFRLHALDIRTGSEQPSSPVVIGATVPGSGSNSSGGIVTFRAFKQLQRSSLLLANGTVYIAFAGHGEQEPYNGWLLGYNASNVQQQTVVVNLSPDTQAAGIWQSGAGPAADTNGNIYAMTGNGALTIGSGGFSYGDSFVKVSPTGSILDYFSPSDQVTLNTRDLDLGSSGVLLVPDTNLVVGGGKEGKLYVVDTDTGHMGGFNTTDNVVQEFQVTPGTDMHIGGTPVYWNGPNGAFMYTWGDTDHLKQFHFANRLFATTPISQSAIAALQDGAGQMSISANGATPGTGILWSAMASSGNSDTQTRTGILRAFDASDVTKELWNSDQNAARDAVGNRAKFVSPTIANGKVYLATFSGVLDVYGLLSATPTPTNTPTSSGTPATPTPTNTPGPSSTSTASPTSSPTSSPTPSGTLFADNFEADPIGSAPAGWTATGGAWSVSLDQSHVVTQTATVSSAAELTAGNPGWTDYTVSVDVKAPGGTAAFGILGRWHDFNDTYLLLLRNGTGWQLAKRVNGTFSQIGSGTFTQVAGTWYTLQLAFSGSTITASIDSTVLKTVKDASLTGGLVGFHTLSTPEYDNVLVTGSAPAATPTPTSTLAATPSPTTTLAATPSPTSTLSPIPTSTTSPTISPTSSPTPSGTLFSDTFESDTVGASPAGWTISSGGTWKVGQDQSHMVQQTATIGGASELTAGSAGWTNYTFSASVKAPGGVAPFGITGRWHDFNDTYMLLLHDGTTWQLAKRVGGTFTQLASGPFSPVTGTWYTLRLSFSGTTITASIGNTVLKSIQDSSLASGMIGFRASNTPEYDNALVTTP